MSRTVVGVQGTSLAGASEVGRTWLHAVCDDGSTWQMLLQHGSQWEETWPVPGSVRDLDPAKPAWMRRAS